MFITVKIFNTNEHLLITSVSMDSRSDSVPDAFRIAGGC